jgi:hypothetical protein
MSGRILFSIMALLSVASVDALAESRFRPTSVSFEHSRTNRTNSFQNRPNAVSNHSMESRQRSFSDRGFRTNRTSFSDSASRFSRNVEAARDQDRHRNTRFNDHDRQFLANDGSHDRRNRNMRMKFEDPGMRDRNFDPR